VRILVVGGTGPSGPYVLEGLLARGHEVTILHRGVHEPPGLPDVPHIHADPHFAESLSEALGRREFDAVFGLYGRLQVLADFFAGRCGRFISVGGRPVCDGYLDPRSSTPRGMRVCADESAPLADPARIRDPKVRAFVEKAIAAEQAVMSHHRAGAYRATHFRYPYVYGLRALGPFEWSIIKRIQDGRSFVNLPLAGLVTGSRGAAQNVAHCVLLALDSERAAGEIFHCGDEVQYSLAQWTELIARCMGAELEIVDVPNALRWTVTNFLVFAGTAADLSIFDISKAKQLLGYRDVVGPAKALAETVAWYRDNPVDWQGNALFPDRFDYALEDRVRAALESLGRSFEAERPEVQAVHTYAHPKKASIGGADERGR
jgi:nucleoside-diphosphate-sugar epimerase